MDHQILFVGKAQRLPEQLVDGIGNSLLEDTIPIEDGTVRRILQLMLEVLQARRKRLV